MLPIGEDPAAARLRRLAALASRWAARSSATVEDGAALSYAGIFRSELEVPAADLAAAIAQARASVYDDWEPRAVLLTDQTDPDWVPLMAEAAALVTAEGGMLCHAAIVSRELGVPCVTGVGAAALERLASSGLLAVDGTAGTVSVLSGA
jgi:phosphoenolpyruvate synthase/pyruvate phosphate dikinase